MFFGLNSNLKQYTNRPEHRTFLQNAFAWVGSASPRVLPGVALSVAYCSVVRYLVADNTELALDIGPFEYSGVVLGLMLVFRINAGYDRWWEARKLWGSIVNQSRNLGIIGLAYPSSAPARWKREFSSLVQALPHLMRLSLRADRSTQSVSTIVSTDHLRIIESASHPPTLCALLMQQSRPEARTQGWMDSFSFQRAERERAILVDDIGACERILKTPMPFVFAIKLKRFLLFFLLLLPFALVYRLGWWSVLVDFLIAYPLLALDRIGLELQNPFARENLSHLPLNDICETIQKNVLEVENGVLAVAKEQPRPRLSEVRGE